MDDYSFRVGITRKTLPEIGMQQKGVAKCLNWREILLALPDWDCFSAPSTNRDLLDSFFFLSQHFVDSFAQLASCGERNSLIQDCYAFPSSTRHARCGKDAPWKA